MGSIQSTPRNILVTGGAQGIGRAIVERFLAGGDHVIIVDNLPLPETNSGRKEFSYYRVDLSDLSQITAFTAELLKTFLNIDILVNNAATGFHFINLMEMQIEHWDMVQATNLRGAAILVKTCLERMIPARKGVIVNIASCAAFLPEPGHTAYAASKAGLLAFTKCLAREVGRSGIRVVSVVPGWIETENNTPTEEDKRWLADNVSLGRAGRKEEIAEVVWFLASDSASYITGQAFIVDGGMT
jgi:NAD(P)-dependent dehydrogenase (short-subunit alcohol dehydrogenase family)